jgi:hypothetical protein
MTTPSTSLTPSIERTRVHRRRRRARAESGDLPAFLLGAGLFALGFALTWPMLDPMPETAGPAPAAIDRQVAGR